MSTRFAGAAFNNAGAVNAFGPIAEIDTASWRADLDLNLDGVFYGLRHQVPAITASGGGAILNNALISGAVDTPAFRASMGATGEGEAAIAALHPMGRISHPRRSPPCAPSCSAARRRSSPARPSPRTAASPRSKRKRKARNVSQ